MIKEMIQDISCLNDPDYGFLVYCLELTQQKKSLSLQDYLRLEILAKQKGKVYNIHRYQENDFQVHFDRELESRYAGDNQVMGRTPASCICVF